MKIACVTTTINVPHVLELYRVCSKDVVFFVAVDNKTPMFGELRISDVLCMRGENWKCSELIGWNCIQRRNIAFLEALKWGADAIVSVDDDNIPMGTSYFDDFEAVLEFPFNGVGVGSEAHWFDIGKLLIPPAKHRGFPYQLSSREIYGSVVGAKVGAAAGLCFGDPDIDATTRMVNHPFVHGVSEIVQSGMLLEPKNWTVFNSQNTAMLREFIPAWFMWPGVGRMDDIYASLVVQRVMRERGYCVHFGRPFVIQQRNQHNLVKDLRGEIDGYEIVYRLAGLLDEVQLPGESVIHDCRRIWDTLANTAWVPERTIEAAFAYLSDCETVL